MTSLTRGVTWSECAVVGSVLWRLPSILILRREREREKGASITTPQSGPDKIFIKDQDNFNQLFKKRKKKYYCGLNSGGDGGDGEGGLRIGTFIIILHEVLIIF